MIYFENDNNFNLHQIPYFEPSSDYVAPKGYPDWATEQLSILVNELIEHYNKYVVDRLNEPAVLTMNPIKAEEYLTSLKNECNKPSL